MRSRTPKPTSKPIEISAKNAAIKVTIVAEIELFDSDGDPNDVNEQIERALDTLRENGSADVTDRRILGLPT